MEWSSFIKKFPVLTHITSQNAVESIKESGLLSASQLVQRTVGSDGHLAVRWLGPIRELDSQQEWRIQSPEEVVRTLRFRRWAEVWPKRPWILEEHHRACRMAIRSTDDRSNVVRIVFGNHYPLGGNRDSIQELLRDGFSVQEWIALLNRLAFVFPDKGEQMQRFEERHQTQVSESGMLKIETRRLPPSAQERLRLSGINGGGINGALLRGKDTYLPVSEWKSCDSPLEIVFDGGLTREELGECLIM